MRGGPGNHEEWHRNWDDEEEVEVEVEVEEEVTKEKEVHHGQDGGEKAGLPPWAYGKDEPDRNAHLANNYNRENKRGQYVDGGFKAKDEYGGAAYGP
jgi:hypothetical protein